MTVARTVAALAFIGVLMTGCAAAKQPAPSPAASESTAPFDEAARPEGLPDEPIASMPSSREGLIFEVYQLKRTSKESVHLTMAVVLKDDFDEDVQLGNDFGPGGSMKDVALFDPAGLKRYMVYLDEEDDCLCFTVWPSVALQPGERRYYSAIFPAPPEDVTTLTVDTPIGALSDIPLGDE